MRITHESRNYRAADVQRRYVRYSRFDNTFHFCEVGADRRFDLRQGTVDRKELPEAVAQLAVDKCGQWPSYVDWPPA